MLRDVLRHAAREGEGERESPVPESGGGGPGPGLPRAARAGGSPRSGVRRARVGGVLRRVSRVVRRRVARLHRPVAPHAPFDVRMGPPARSRPLAGAHGLGRDGAGHPRHTLRSCGGRPHPLRLIRRLDLSDALHRARDLPSHRRAPPSVSSWSGSTVHASRCSARRCSYAAIMCSAWAHSRWTRCWKGTRSSRRPAQAAIRQQCWSAQSVRVTER